MHSDHLVSAISVERLRSYALTLLTRRSYSEQQLKQKLQLFAMKQIKTYLKSQPSDSYEDESDIAIFVQTMVEQVLFFCSEYHYIDDNDYIKMQLKGYLKKGDGYFKVCHRLQQKGFSKSLIEKTLLEIDPDWVQIAKEALEKKFSRTQISPRQSIEDRQRCYRFLHSRGFTSEEIKDSIAKFDK